MSIIKKKISEFDAASKLTGLWTLGYSIENGLQKTVRIALDFLKTAADKANTAATAADEVREGIQGDLAGKADLDEAKKYVNPSQLDPLYGYQTGVKLDKGYFRTVDESLLFTGDRTILAVFVTGNDVTTRQAVFRDGYNNQHNTVSVASGWITGRVGGTSYQAAAQANTLYEVVLVKTADGCKVSVNGVVQNKALAGDAAEARFIEIGNSENVPFFGRIISVRVFNFAFSDTDIAASWNGGHPELWRVLDIWRNIVHSQWPSDGSLGCLLDLTPAGLLPTLWRDMSGQGNDVPYVPNSGNPTNVEFSYENVGYSDVLTGIAAPSIAPNFVGQTYIDTQNKNVYKATGTSSAADWKNI